MKSKTWTDEEIELLKGIYPKMGKKYCMDFFGKTESQVRSKASSLGLKQDKDSEFFKDWQARAAKSKVGKVRPDQSALMKKMHDDGVFAATFTEERRKQISSQTKKYIEENGHPRGMLGKSHTDDAKSRMSEASSRIWREKSDEEKSAIGLKRSKAISERGLPQRVNATWKSGWREIGGYKKFYRSRWEANYARYLQMLKERGEISNWLHEPDTFWFDGILRGTRSYLPDFKVFHNDGRIEYHETKGWMDQRSRTQQKRMKKYHPEVVIVLIQQKEYTILEKQFSSSIYGWELPSKK